MPKTRGARRSGAVPQPLPLTQPGELSPGGEWKLTRFFIDERAARHGITLTDDLLELANGLQAEVLPLEIDAS